MNLLLVEMRRALHRRVVWVLIGLALIACVFAGVVAFIDASNQTVFELQSVDAHPAVMADWWIAGESDGAILIAAFFLLLGGLFGGASVAGAEWRAGTITTVLTWEPRRVRLLSARTAACGILAAAIGFALQIIFLGAFLPAVLAYGTTAGTDGAWWGALLWVMARLSLLTALAAMIAVGLATIGRNTAFALTAAFAWVAVIEGIIRANKPGLTQYLWGENIATTLTWAQMDGVDFQRSPLVALLTMVFYTVAIVSVATILFRQRDIAGGS